MSNVGYVNKLSLGIGADLKRVEKTKTGIEMTCMVQPDADKCATVNTVAMVKIDEIISASIERDGIPFTLQASVRARTFGADFFFRTIILCGLKCGLFGLPAMEAGKYPSTNPEIKGFLALISEKTSSLRKAASKYVRYAWLATYNGHAVELCSTVQSLELAARPSSDTTISLVQDMTKSSAEKDLHVEEEIAIWNWQNAYQESVIQSKRSTEAAILSFGSEPTFQLESNSPVTIVRTAIELLRRHPDAFPRELAELRTFLLGSNHERCAQQGLPGHQEFISIHPVSPLVTAANWLINLESVTLAALRIYLLPLDLLSGAVIDELNERALDLTGEIALEESGEEIMIAKEVLFAVIANLE